VAHGNTHQVVREVAVRDAPTPPDVDEATVVAKLSLDVTADSVDRLALEVADGDGFNRARGVEVRNTPTLTIECAV
jgi:hypothetical protein